jgi:hypothetical protein
MMVVYGLASAIRDTVKMYDLIVDEIFVGTFDTWELVLKELVSINSVIFPLNVRIDYHE